MTLGGPPAALALRPERSGDERICRLSPSMPGDGQEPRSCASACRPTRQSRVPSRVVDCGRARRLPDEALATTAQSLWLGRTLGRLIEPLVAGNRLSAWVFAPPDVPDADLTAYTTATPATETSQAWWKHTRDYVVEVMQPERAIWVVADSVARPSDPFLQKDANTAEQMDRFRK